MFCWAPRSLAAATMFIALVICEVFLTASIFRLMSRKVAIIYALLFDYQNLTPIQP